MFALGAKGERNQNAVLSAGIVQLCRYLYWVELVPITRMASQYHLKYQTLRDAVNYDSWLHVEDTFDYTEVKRKKRR